MRIRSDAFQPARPAPSSAPAAPAPRVNTLQRDASTFQAADPNAMALVGLKRGSGTPAQVKELQDDLVALGCLDPSIRQNVGYGHTFGPLTEAGLKKLQGQFGLAQTGVVDSATATLLLNGGAAPAQPPSTTPPAQTWPGAPAGDPASSALVGLANGSSDAPRVKALQDDLLRMGYVDASFAQNSGYGNHFGPLTQAALQQFQDDNGLPQTGVVDAATADALRSPRPRAQGIAVGPAHAYRDQLGLPTGPLTTLQDGSVRQDFDKGYVLCTPDATLYVMNSANQPIVPAQKLGVATSIDQANQSFVSQWGPTPWNSANGAPYGYEDCGPTSCAMVLSALGLIAHPAPGDAEKTIDAMRDAALGFNSTQSQGTNDPQLERALKANGAQASEVNATLANVDAALAAGHPLIVGSSSTWQAWGYNQAVAGKYLNHRDPGGHFVTVLGKAQDGNYVVGDPLSKTGAMEVTSDQMKTLLGSAWKAIEVSRP